MVPDINFTDIHKSSAKNTWTAFQRTKPNYKHTVFHNTSAHIWMKSYVYQTI